MWKIEPWQVISFKHDPGGDRFTQLVDSLIRAQGLILGIPFSEIHTSVRTNRMDGGVDTEVSVAVEMDPTGYFGYPTVWQYKAVDSNTLSDDDLKAEIHKYYAKELIEKGYAYRLCVSDDFPPSTRAHMSDLLTTEAQTIRSDSPKAQVISASDFANWASMFPAIVLQLFIPGLADEVLLMSTWGADSKTLKYVPIPSWQPIQDAILSHLNFGESPVEVVMPVQGESGVGKTRLVYESLRLLPGAEGLVVYTNDPGSALRVSNMLANSQSSNAILIADESDPITRHRINRLLYGHRGRVRAICIDNTGNEPPSGAPQYKVERMPIEQMGEVLRSNFPEVPDERRRTYAELAEGFVLLASDMCRYDTRILDAGHTGPVLATVDDYLRYRLKEAELRILAALSLVNKVGFKGEVEDELRLLAELVQIGKADIEGTAHDLSHKLGFVQTAGRYFAVTPEIVAQAAFDHAWRTWARQDIGRFLEAVPESLTEAFLQRVGKSAAPEVRSHVGDYFRGWASNLDAAQLANLSATLRFVKLTDIDPVTYLPILRRIIDSTSISDLLSITGDSINGKWGPRRQLVWLVERLVSFPEFFDDAENILLRLALAESEPRIGNNASAIWRQLYHIYLSGTAIPFTERIARLGKHIVSVDDATSELAVSALDGAMSPSRARIATPAVVAGRIPPPDWQPSSAKEEMLAFESILSLVGSILREGSAHVRARMLVMLISNVQFLLARGCLKQMRDIVRDVDLSVASRAELVSEIEEFIGFESEDAAESLGTAKYREDVADWMSGFIHKDLHSRLAVAVGTNSWRINDDDWIVRVRSLAGELSASRQAFDAEIEWLSSLNTNGVLVLAQELGRLDNECHFLEPVIRFSVAQQSSTLGRGYILGLLESGTQCVDRVNCALDAIQEAHPKIVYDLALAGGQQLNALTRVISLIDGKKLPASYLRGFTYLKPMDADSLAICLDRMLSALDEDEMAADAAIDLVAYRLHRSTEDHIDPAISSPVVLPLVWRLLEATSSMRLGNSEYWWSKILIALSKLDSRRTARIAANTLVSSIGLARDADKALREIARDYPGEVMEELGASILDSEKGWYFYVGAHSKLISSIPEEIVICWITQHGIEAARRLARHLPLPKGGQVPLLTAWVLTEYETDDRLFHEFCAGSHSLQMYSGDIAAQHEAEAAAAHAYLNHPIKRIREWAEYEIRNGEQEAAYWRQKDAEMDLGD